MALKKLMATDKDRLLSRQMKIDSLRELLRDVYDITKNGKPMSEGLMSRIRSQMAPGKMPCGFSSHVKREER